MGCGRQPQSACASLAASTVGELGTLSRQAESVQSQPFGVGISAFRLMRGAACDGIEGRHVATVGWLSVQDPRRLVQHKPAPPPLPR
eukprot:2935313-Rhodomonas_salina.1